MTTKKRRYSVFGDDDEETPPVEPLASNQVIRQEGNSLVTESDNQVKTNGLVPDTVNKLLPETEEVNNEQVNIVKPEKQNTEKTKSVSQVKTKKPNNLLTDKPITIKPKRRGKSDPDRIIPPHATFYFDSEADLDKLDELARAYKKRTGIKINRNDIVRYLVELVTLDMLMAGTDNQ